MYSANIVKYFFVGGFCFVIDFSIFSLFAKFYGYNYLIVNAVSFSIATVANYFLCIAFVFKSGLKYKKMTELLLVFFVSGFSLAVNQVLLFSFVDYFHFELLISKAVAVLFTFLLNYFGRSFFVFGH